MRGLRKRMERVFAMLAARMPGLLRSEWKAQAGWSGLAGAGYMYFIAPLGPANFLIDNLPRFEVIILGIFFYWA